MRFPGPTHLLLFGDDKEALKAMRAGIEERLCGLRLTMHEGKSRVYRTQDGITFLGWRVFPDRMRLGRSNVRRLRRRLARLHCEYVGGLIGLKEVQTRLLAWVAHAVHGDTWQLRRSIFSGYKFGKRGVV